MSGLPADLVTGQLDLAAGRAWLASADRVLIGAGAGLSAAAGFDYADRKRFAELFPALARAGFSARYELVGRWLPPQYQWGFWAVHTTDIRFGAEPAPLYRRLRELVGDRDHFVLSSNVDQLFMRNGFDAACQFTPQGDYGLYQCLRPCTRQVWDSRPIISRALGHYDEASGRTTAVPKCPNCGGAVSLNVNAGSWYIQDHFLPGADRASAWLAEAAQRAERVAVLEIGAGFNTPGVVRWPIEEVVAGLPQARLIRVNLDHPGVPAGLASRSVSLRLRADEAITALGAPPGI